MALRDQPYLPLYIQDFLTDEKLAECSAQSTGVYIRIMCLMHKSEQYGKILLKQKHKQSDKQILNFALLLAKHFPYDVDVIHSSLIELIEEGVLILEGDFLIQRRMVKDNELSIKRSLSGREGGKNSLGKNKYFAQAKSQANSENENEYVNDNENVFEEGVQGEKPAEGPKPETKPKKTKDEILLESLKTDEGFDALFLRWLKYKRERGESYKGTDSAQLAYNKLVKLSAGDKVRAKEIIEHSMSNNYAGLFESKTTKPNGNRHQQVSCIPGEYQGRTTL